MINDVTPAAVHTHTSISNEIKKGLSTFNKKSVSFLGCQKILNIVYRKYKKLEIRHKIIVPYF